MPQGNKAENGKHGAHTGQGQKGGKEFEDRIKIEAGFLTAISNAKMMAMYNQGTYGECLETALSADAKLKTLILENPHLARYAISVLPRSKCSISRFVTKIQQTQRLPRRGKNWRKKK